MRCYEMPVCPKCGKQIDFLKNYVYSCTNEYILRITSTGEPEYKFIDAVDGESEEFCCPECGAKLFEEEADAINFLKQDLTKMESRRKVEV